MRKWYNEFDKLEFAGEIMIILITGASHTGKTALAQKLLEKYKYPYLSIDHLKMGLIRSDNTELTPMDDNELTEYLWPIVREMIKTAIENKQNLIVEGGYIPFDWSKDFEQEYLEYIKYYCLVMSEDYIRNHFADIKGYANTIENKQNLIVEGGYIPFDWQKDFNSEYLENIKYYCLVMSEEYIRNYFSDIKKYANVIENRLDDEWCTMESVLSENAQMLEFAKKYNVNYILIDDKYEINIEF